MVIDKDTTTIIEGAGTRQSIESRVKQLRAQIADTTSWIAAGTEDMSLGAVVVLLVLGGLVAAALVSTAGVKRWNIASATTTVDVGAVAASDARDLIRMDSDKG